MTVEQFNATYEAVTWLLALAFLLLLNNKIGKVLNHEVKEEDIAALGILIFIMITLWVGDLLYLILNLRAVLQALLVS